jgi:hypothetical protein
VKRTQAVLVGVGGDDPLGGHGGRANQSANQSACHVSGANESDRVVD